MVLLVIYYSQFHIQFALTQYMTAADFQPHVS